MDHKKFLLMLMSLVACALHTVCARGNNAVLHGRRARAAANVVIDRPTKCVAVSVKTQVKKASKKIYQAHKKSKKKNVLKQRQPHMKKKKKAVPVRKKKQLATPARRGKKLKSRSTKKRRTQAKRTFATRMHADYPSSDKMVAIAKMFGSDIDLKS